MPLIPVRPKTWVNAKVIMRWRSDAWREAATRRAWYAVLGLSGAIAVLAGLAGYVVAEIPAAPIQAIGQAPGGCGLVSCGHDLSAVVPLLPLPPDSRHGQPKPVATRVPAHRNQKPTPVTPASPPHPASPRPTAPVPAAPSPACSSAGGCGGDGWYGGWNSSGGSGGWDSGGGSGGWDSSGWHSGGWHSGGGSGGWDSGGWDSGGYGGW
jgi:uncharacterized membrane protein YgcG